MLIKLISTILNAFGQSGLMKGSWKTTSKGVLVRIYGWLGAAGTGIYSLIELLSGNMVDFEVVIAGIISVITGETIGTGFQDAKDKDTSTEAQIEADADVKTASEIERELINLEQIADQKRKKLAKVKKILEKRTTPIKPG